MQLDTLFQRFANAIFAIEGHLQDVPVHRSWCGRCFFRFTHHIDLHASTGDRATELLPSQQRPAAVQLTNLLARKNAKTFPYAFQFDPKLAKANRLVSVSDRKRRLYRYSPTAKGQYVNLERVFLVLLLLVPRLRLGTHWSGGSRLPSAFALLHRLATVATYGKLPTESYLWKA